VAVAGTLFAGWELVRNGQPTLGQDADWMIRVAGREHGNSAGANPTPPRHARDHRHAVGGAIVASQVVEGSGSD
jgi:hypothetical protein